jgi:hypothetical protein
LSKAGNWEAARKLCHLFDVHDLFNVRVISSAICLFKCCELILCCWSLNLFGMVYMQLLNA